jgi:two-component SAPR family response regulator
VRVLYMSGYTRQAIERRGELEPGDLLQKPFTPDQLATRVREALDD